MFEKHKLNIRAPTRINPINRLGTNDSLAKTFKDFGCQVTCKAINSEMQHDPLNLRLGTTVTSDDFFTAALELEKKQKEKEAKRKRKGGQGKKGAYYIIYIYIYIIMKKGRPRRPNVQFCHVCV